MPILKKSTFYWRGQFTAKKFYGFGPRSEIHTLVPATTYNLRLVAINSVGTSHPSRNIDLTTKEEVPEGPPTDIEASPMSSQSLVIRWKVSH